MNFMIMLYFFTFYSKVKAINFQLTTTVRWLPCKLSVYFQIYLLCPFALKSHKDYKIII